MIHAKSVLLFLSFNLLSCFSFSQSLAYKALLESLYDKDFPVVKPGQITNLQNYQVLDAREMSEFNISHLQGARWIGYETFSMEKTSGLDKKKPVLIYCTVGARSQEIGKKLREAGFERVYNLYGGIIHWKNENNPLFSGDLPTQKVHTYSKSWGIWLNKGEKVF